MHSPLNVKFASPLYRPIPTIQQQNLEYAAMNKLCFCSTLKTAALNSRESKFVINSMDQNCLEKIVIH
jgi:hypothetical protein